MKVFLKDVMTVIEDFAPLQYQESYDNAGLQVGDPEQELTGILLVVDITEGAIREAIEKHCNLIVSHHPLLFHGLKQITPQNYVARCVMMAVKHNIALYASHTNMDKVFNGVSFKMAEHLHLNKVSFLSTEGEEKDQTNQPMRPYGLGVVGFLPEKMSERHFFDLLKDTFGTKAIKHSGFLDREVQKIALCGGSGSDLIKDALRVKADVYVTGDMTYHQFFDHNNQLLIADIGHFESEQYTKEIFLSLLSEKFSNFAVLISSYEKNPVSTY